MALGFSASEANSFLDTWAGTYDFIQLHVGDPGAAGTANVAGNDTRKAVSWAAASGGVLSSNADVDWSEAEVDTTEDYTHVSFWTLASAGTFGGSGTMTANSVNASGDAFQIPSGDIDVTVNVAA